MDELNAVTTLWYRHMISTEEFLRAFGTIVDGE